MDFVYSLLKNVCNLNTCTVLITLLSSVLQVSAKLSQLNVKSAPTLIPDYYNNNPIMVSLSMKGALVVFPHFVVMDLARNPIVNAKDYQHALILQSPIDAKQVCVPRTRNTVLMITSYPLANLAKPDAKTVCAELIVPLSTDALFLNPSIVPADSAELLWPNVQEIPDVPYKIPSDVLTTLA